MSALRTALGRADYRLVLADPPWRYTSWTGASADPRARRVADDVYPTLGRGDVAALGVGEICARDSVLLLWATLPLLPEALGVLTAWGFTYRTTFLVWGKVTHGGGPAVGFGHYTRGNAELLLLGRRGRGVPVVPGVAIPNLLLAPRGRHSAKPLAQYAIIDAVFGAVQPRVELFARQHAPGWEVWGLEAPPAPSLLAL